MPLEEDDAVSVRKWLTDIIGYLSQQSDKKWSCRVRLILFKIFQLLELQQKFLMDDMKCVDGLVLAILAHISDNIAEEITIESICNKFHIGRNTLNRRFKMAINQTVINYVIGCRIDLAKRSLAFTDLTVDEISRETGFHEHTYFTRMFRMREGITPLEYRKIMCAMRPSVRKTKS